MGNVSFIDGHIDEPKRMTDNEIIKALEDEIKNEKFGYEGYLGRGHYPSEKYEKTIAYREAILNLINRLESENNLLQKTNKQLKNSVDFVKINDITELKAKIERLQTEIKLLTENGVTAKYPHCTLCDTGMFLSKEIDGYEKLNAYIRNQAYKEFAERFAKDIEERLSEGIKERNPDLYLIHKILNDLKKEMVGEQRKEDEGK